jgi:hypothetical protein
MPHEVPELVALSFQDLASFHKLGDAAAAPLARVNDAHKALIITAHSGQVGTHTDCHLGVALERAASAR